MRVFITGATGYIGFAVAAAMRRAGHDVYGLTRRTETANRLSALEVIPVVGSMTDPATYLPTVEKCSILIHAAADYADPKAEPKFLDALFANALKGEAPKTLIYTSGIWVIGNTGDSYADETTPLSPAALVKWRAAVEQRVVGATEFRGLVIRPGCVYGQRGGLTAEWMKGVAGIQPLRVVGDGSNHWPMVHVEDLSDAYVRLAESGLRGEIFNVTDRSRNRVRDMVERLIAVTGFAGSAEYVPLEQARQGLGDFADCLALDQHVDSGKAVRLLGWQPRFGGFVDGAATYYAAWKSLLSET